MCDTESCDNGESRVQGLAIHTMVIECHMGWVEIIRHDSLLVCFFLLFCGLEWVGDLAQSDQER